MISQETRNQYKVTIGIECHVQFKTKSKLFSSADNDAREAAPNTLVNHVDFGLPGALPVLNETAVRLATKAAFALDTVPQKFSKFDRKHYFYPDLPMGYQITQYDEPIVLGGQVKIEVEGEEKVIGITRAHMEADAGKSTHPVGKDYSLVDLNRAGTPLLEIVSEPDMHTAAEAKAYVRELYLLMRYADVSDANLYYGNMRFDVNVSVSKTEELGTRTETKNLNSFRAVEKVVDYEVSRQIERLEKGEKITQETRGWDDAKQKTFTQRTKENADDYRYMPDPDLPPIVLEDDYIEKIKAEMGPSLEDMRSKFYSLGADAALTETILDNPTISYFLLSLEKEAVKLIKAEISPNVYMQITNWVGQLAPKLAEETHHDLEELHLDAAKLITLSKMYDEGEISSTQAKVIFEAILLHDVDPEPFAQENDMLQVSDEAEIAKIVEQVLAENAKAAEDVKNGEMKAVGFLVGQVMKQSQGKANPQLAQNLIKKQLGL